MLKRSVCFQQAMLIDLGNDHDDVFGEASEKTEACASSMPASDLLSIDQLLETVWSSTQKLILLSSYLSVLGWYGHEPCAHVDEASHKSSYNYSRLAW